MLALCLGVGKSCYVRVSSQASREREGEVCTSFFARLCDLIVKHNYQIYGKKLKFARS